VKLKLRENGVQMGDRERDGGHKFNGDRTRQNDDDINMQWIHKER
jgi:hypothetical protein